MAERVVSKIGKFLLGESCNKCKPFGIECRNGTLLNFPIISALPGESAVMRNDITEFRTPEKVSECPVNQGEDTVENIVQEVNKKIGILNTTTFGPRGFNKYS